jgi:V8-like Glu-specific endopeptidase
MLMLYSIDKNYQNKNMVKNNIFKYILLSIYLFLPSCTKKNSSNNQPPEVKKELKQSDLIREKAKVFTVKISTKTGDNGTGVIFKNNGNKYYVLTTKHTFKNREESEPIKIITFDNKNHTVTSKLLEVSDLDLVFLEFTSREQYQLAEFSDQVDSEKPVYLFGYKACDKNTGSELESEEFNIGQIFKSTKDKDIHKSSQINQRKNQNKPKEYDVFYKNASIGGMSGSPLLNIKGQVIAIHGESEYNKETIEDATLQSCQKLPREFENNWGISVKNFSKNIK